MWRLWKQTLLAWGGDRAHLRECAKEGEVMTHTLHCTVQPPIAVEISNILENFQKSHKANLTLLEIMMPIASPVLIHALE